MTSHVKDLTPLNILFVLSGIQPVHDRLQSGSKLSVVGLTLIAINIILLLYSDKKLRQEQEIIDLQDNILYAMTTVQRVCSLAIPIVIVIGSYFQFDSMDSFIKLQDNMDAFLKGTGVDVTEMHRRMKRMQNVATVVAVILSVISCVSAVYTFCDTFSVGISEAEFYTYYTGYFLTLNFVGYIFKISVYYYAVSLRFDYFNDRVEKIMNLDRRVNLRIIRKSQ